MRNAEHFGLRTKFEAGLVGEIATLLYDPQTSGGLLVAVTATAVDRAVSALAAAGTQAVKIGTAESFRESGPRVYVV